MTGVANLFLQSNAEMEGLVSRNERRGLTLVELLAVIAIIGLLVGLLMPAVQSARDAARRTTASHKLRQMAHAAQAYLSSMGFLPPAQGATADDHVYGPVHMHLLPFIEQAALWDSILGQRIPAYANPVTTPAGPFCWKSNNVFRQAIDVFLSPADPSVLPGGVQMFGTEPTGQASFAYSFQAFGNPRQTSYPPTGNGCANAPGSRAAWFGMMTQAKFRDGMGTTIMFAEKFAKNGDPGQANDGSTLWAYEWRLRWPGFAIPGVAPATTGPTSKFGGPPHTTASPDHAAAPRHTGILVARCDGGTALLNADIHPDVWWAAVTARGNDQSQEAFNP